jgi:hypothetical protein
MHFGIYRVFYSQNSHHHVKAGIPSVFKVMFLVQEYHCGKLSNHYSIITII